MTTYSARRTQTGLSLVELMIAMVIGLIIIAGVAQIMLSGKQSYNTQSGTGALQENGRFALFFLQRDIRMAGFPRSFGPGGTQPIVAPFVYDSSAAADDTTFEGASNAPDQIIIQFNSDTDVPGSNLDCLGQQITDASFQNADGTFRVINRYFIANGALSCEGNGNPDRPQPIVQGVDSMQILYGEDVDDDTYADVYRNAAQVVDWNRVAAVRLALLINSLERVADMPDTQEYALLDAAPLNTEADRLPNPLFRRQVFTTTIEVRNRTQ